MNWTYNIICLHMKRSHLRPVSYAISPRKAFVFDSYPFKEWRGQKFPGTLNDRLRGINKSSQLTSTTIVTLPMCRYSEGQ